MPRGFYNDLGEFYEHKPRSIIKSVAKEYREIYCNCDAVLRPMPTNPTKRFECWDCCGCSRQITRKQIRDSMNRAKAIIEQELPEIKILVLLSSITIQSNEFIGHDRRSIKSEPLTTKTIDDTSKKTSRFICALILFHLKQKSHLFIAALVVQTGRLPKRQ